jgi:hypothetical protein
MGELKVQQSEERAVEIRKAAEDGAVNYQKQRRMSMEVGFVLFVFVVLTRL